MFIYFDIIDSAKKKKTENVVIVMMFVSQLSLRLFRANFNVALNTVRCFNFALGKTESELIEKWKRKFASEQISEVDESIKHILNHVQKEVDILF